MNLILLDWTRMGKWYCLAGAVPENGRWRIVRPLLVRYRDAPVRNVGWSPYLLDGHARWEVFDLIGPQEAKPEPPHLEDLWVRSLRSQRRLASPEQRRAILEATRGSLGETLFGVPLCATRSAAYLNSGTGARSLTTLMVPAGQITFQGNYRAGADEADIRVRLDLPGWEDRLLPVKDHHLLCRAERAGQNLQGRIEVLNQAVRQMGEPVAVRLGLSRAFKPRADCETGFCWLMADGFFSLSDPQA
jgi:hypothetical protein